MKYLVWLTLFASIVIGALYIVSAEKIDATAPVAEVLDSPWVAAGDSHSGGTSFINATELYAGCASCHMADGSGRSDGLVPRLAGQNEAVLVHKLQKLRDGQVALPVMMPFARALSADEIIKVAGYISALAKPQGGVSLNQDYIQYCGACHGLNGEGSTTLLAPALCAQHGQYLSRRLDEIKHNLRGDADLSMMLVLETIDQQTLDNITQWLAVGQCLTSNEHSGESL